MSYTVRHSIREELPLIGFKYAVNTAHFIGKGVLDDLIPHNVRGYETHHLHATGKILPDGMYWYMPERIANYSSRIETNVPWWDYLLHI